MKVKVIGEFGFDQAMLGLSLNKNQPVENMPKVAEKLIKIGNGHDNFAEQMIIYLDINMPRYFWQQFDRYRMCSRQSASTMHTILKRPLTEEDFVYHMIDKEMLRGLNILIETKQFEVLKAMLPEGFMQRRVVMLSYKTLRNIINQRKGHHLKEWSLFINEVAEQVEHPEFIIDLSEKLK